MLRSFLLGRGGKTRAYGVYRPADGVEERGAAAREIFLVGQRSHLSKRDVIVQHLVLVVEQHGGDVRVALDLLLLFDKLVESAYRVGGRSSTNTISVEFSLIKPPFAAFAAMFIRILNAFRPYQR